VPTAADTVRTAYAAFAAGDIAAVLDTFADDIVWNVPPVDGWGGTFRGKDEVLGFFAGLPGRYGVWNLATEEFVDADGRLLVLGHHEFPDADRIPFAHLWSVTGGKATTFVEYVDNSALLRHLADAAVA